MADINITEVTEGTLTGNGSFDVLMKTVTLHLQEEFDNARISSSQYSEVYLGALGHVLQQSVTFTLGRQQADKSAELATKQGQQVDNEKLLIAQRIISEKSKVQEVITGQELESIGVVGDGGARLPQFTVGGIINQERLNAVEIVNISKEKLKTEEANNTIPIGGITLANYNKINAESALLIEKEYAEKSTYDTVSYPNGLAAFQKAKVVAETSFIQQKTATESAQIKDIVDSVEVKGIVGAQKALYLNQGDGFKRDAEQKAAKIGLDYLALLTNKDATSVTSQPHFVRDLGTAETGANTNSDLNKTLKQLFDAVMPPPPPPTA